MVTYMYLQQDTIFEVIQNLSTPNIYKKAVLQKKLI